MPENYHLDSIFKKIQILNHLNPFIHLLYYKLWQHSRNKGLSTEAMVYV